MTDFGEKEGWQSRGQEKVRAEVQNNLASSEVLPGSFSLKFPSMPECCTLRCPALRAQTKPSISEEDLQI